MLAPQNPSGIKPKARRPSIRNTTAQSQMGKARSEGLVIGFGRYFSNFNLLALTLYWYVFACVVTYMWLAVDLGTIGGLAATIAYDVATGGNPIDHIEHIRPKFPFLWVWLLLIHVVSWLMVPVLAAATVDAAYRSYEEKRIRNDRRLRDIMRNRLKAQLKGISPEKLEKIIEGTVERFGRGGKE